MGFPVCFASCCSTFAGISGLVLICFVYLCRRLVLFLDTSPVCVLIISRYIFGGLSCLVRFIVSVPADQVASFFRYFAVAHDWINSVWFVLLWCRRNCSRFSIGLSCLLLTSPSFFLKPLLWFVVRTTRLVLAVVSILSCIMRIHCSPTHMTDRVQIGKIRVSNSFRRGSCLVSAVNRGGRSTKT